MTDDTDDKTVVAIVDKAWRKAPWWQNPPRWNAVHSRFRRPVDSRPQGTAAYSSAYVKLGG